jgi:hypothetical protein
MRMKNGTATWEDDLQISYKIKHTLITQSNNYRPRYLTKLTENLHPHKNMHTDVDSSFIHNCQKLEATKITFSS